MMAELSHGRQALIEDLNLFKVFKPIYPWRGDSKATKHVGQKNVNKVEEEVCSFLTDPHYNLQDRNYLLLYKLK